MVFKALNIASVESEIVGQQVMEHISASIKGNDRVLVSKEFISFNLL